MQRSNTMSNIVIVGSGPAGVSAALYLSLITHLTLPTIYSV